MSSSLSVVTELISMPTPPAPAPLATVMPPPGSKDSNEPTGASKHGNTQLLAQDLRRRIDPGDVAQHARLEGDRIKRHAVAPQRRLGLGGADQVVPDVGVEPKLRRLHDLVQRHVFVFQPARHGSLALFTLGLAQQ